MNHKQTIPTFSVGWMGLLLSCLLLAPSAFSQPIEIPDQFQIGNLKVIINESGKAAIQSRAEMRLSDAKGEYGTKAKAYFPLIERILKEEAVPDEVKYLVLLESNLDADIVNTKSQTVGYWQFKEASAKANGLVINSQVDERKNISASTRAAAQQLKKDYPTFGNWMYVILAYQLGNGGARKYADKKYYNVQEMVVDSKTPPFLLKFLATVFAYQQGMPFSDKTSIQIENYPASGTTLKQVSEITMINYNQLKSYNPWLKTDQIPADKEYLVTIPAAKAVDDEPEPGFDPEHKKVYSELKVSQNRQVAIVEAISGGNFQLALDPEKRVEIDYLINEPHVYDLRNGLKVIKAKPGDTKDEIALAIGLDRAAFSAYNDLAINQKLEAGKIYYLEEKHKRGLTAVHQVEKGQTLWDVAQQHGVQLDRLLKYNNFSSANRPLREGETIRLQ